MTLPRLSTLGGLKEGDLYVERPADQALLRALERGEYAYVLSSRQTGKTSLMSRTLRKLSAKGYRCAKIDLGGLGSEAEPDGWYLGLAMEIAAGVGCAEDFAQNCFKQTRRLTAVQRFIRFLRTLVAQDASPLVIFMDEIEGFLKLPMRVTDDFLTAVRSLYNDRDQEPLYRRLSFCLMGVCTPNELIRDERRTPFNVCRGIDLEDFSWEAVKASFMPLFEHAGTPAEAALRHLYSWSGGHPFLTHRLAEEFFNRCSDGATPEPALIDALVRELFLGNLGGEQENFLEVERRLCLGQAHRVHRRLALYKSVLRGEKIFARGHDLIQLELRLTGLIRELRQPKTEPRLTVRNRIFAAVFDESWTPKLAPAKLDLSFWMKEQTEHWIELGRQDAFVLRGEELFAARKWADTQPTLEPACREFLDASRRVDDRERGLRLNSLLFMTLWASSASFLLLPLLLDYWHQRAYPGGSAINYLYAVPFIFALPAGVLTDRYQVRSSQVIIIGLLLRLLGCCVLAADLYIHKAAVAVTAVVLVVLGQILLRPQAAVLLGALYPRNDRRANQAFIVFYLFVNIGALLGPLIGSAMYRQYGWLGAIGTMIGGLSVALYGFASSYSAFTKLSFPPRDDADEPLVSRRRRWQTSTLLWVTLLAFWAAFYGLGNYLSTLQDSIPLKIPTNNLELESLLAQGLSSETITPIFILLLTPVLIILFHMAKRFKKEPSLSMRMGSGAVTIAILLLILFKYGAPAHQKHLLMLYVVLAVAEILVVPASMAATSALSSSKSLFSMMSINYLTAGVGALLANTLLHSSQLEFAVLAALMAGVGLIWLMRRRGRATLNQTPPASL